MQKSQNSQGLVLAHIGTGSSILSPYFLLIPSPVLHWKVGMWLLHIHVYCGFLQFLELWQLGSGSSQGKASWYSRGRTVFLECREGTTQQQAGRWRRRPEIPALGRQVLDDTNEFKDSPVYIVNFRLVEVTE